jgi:hypothetical protein
MARVKGFKLKESGVLSDIPSMFPSFSPNTPATKIPSSTLTKSSYLGDALVHASFPLLLYSTGIMHPITLLGPIANYVFLRYLGGDRETEASQEQRYKKSDRTKYVQLQEYKETKNSFWPRVDELGNPWCWVVVGAGFGGALVEYGAKYWL